MKLLPLLFLAVVLTSCGSKLSSGNSIRIQISRSNGIVYDAANNAFFVSTDNGSILQMNEQGQSVRESQKVEESFTGITRNSKNGYLYAVISGKDRIYEIDPVTLELRQFFILPTAGKSKNPGFESIAFVPDDSEDGGSFYATRKPTGGDMPRVELVQVSLPLASSSIRAPTKMDEQSIKVVDSLEQPDISAMEYDQQNNRLLAISNRRTALIEYSLTGSEMTVFHLPSGNPQGITINDEGVIILIQQSANGSQLVELSR